MESSEFYSELKAKGLLLANHDGKLRVGPKEKLTKENQGATEGFQRRAVGIACNEDVVS